jgi:UDP-N-acetylglucosamine 2-epimerase (non-hydrolysing)
MPEEINRVLTDAIADLLWTPPPDADENLRSEGIAISAIERVGNIMIDAYVMLSDRIEVTPLPIELESGDFAELIPLVFPTHPRTAARMQEFGLMAQLCNSRVQVIKPLGYIEFMALLRRARFVMTDSGGMQEETTYLRILCLTLRQETERPITLTQDAKFGLVTKPARLPRAETGRSSP